MAQSQVSAKKQQGSVISELPSWEPVLLTISGVELQQQYTNFKNNLQQLADRIGNVEQETEEHKYVNFVVFAESLSLPGAQCDYCFP